MSSLYFDNGLPAARDIFTVSRLNREVRILLNASLPLLWVEGELSNLARPTSGHLYFSLKDDGAQVRCAMFRNRNSHLSFKLENGMQVRVRGRVGLYEARGEFQLTVEQMEVAGAGALQHTFEALKRKLESKGLFEAERKQALPAHVNTLGIVTSPTGAAVRDVLSVLRRRFPLISIVVYPVPVQGENAAPAIARMLCEADRRQECDALILTRGGGSLEDLWAFNEESVAWAIAECSLPVISAIGHEIDFTIADFVADQRAPTPSAAAELLSPDQAHVFARLENHFNTLNRWIESGLDNAVRQLNWLNGRLQQQRPEQRIQQQLQRLDDIEQRLQLSICLRLQTQRECVHKANARLQRCSPATRIAQMEGRYNSLHHRLIAAIRGRIGTRVRRLDSATRILETVSPLATLERGYSIVTCARDGTIVRSSTQTSVGETINVQFTEGQLTADVTDVDSE